MIRVAGMFVLARLLVAQPRYILLVAALFSFTVPAAPDEPEPTYENVQTLTVETRKVLADYFDALASGDLVLLGQVTGGDLRVKQASLLANPEYSDTLIRIFGDSEFGIVEYSILSDSIHVAVVDCWFANAERARYRLVLQRVASGEELKVTEARVVP